MQLVTDCGGVVDATSHHEAINHSTIRAGAPDCRQVSSAPPNARARITAFSGDIDHRNTTWHTAAANADMTMCPTGIAE